MKVLITLSLISISTMLSAQWDSVKSYSTYNELEADFMSLDDGYTYVINYWATWCGPCVKELPYFEDLLSKYEDDKVKVVLVSLDFPKKVDSKLLPFLNKHNIKSEVVLLDDPKANDWIDRVDPTWEGAIPVTIIYKGDQRTFWDKEFRTFEDLEQLFLTIH